MRGRGSDPRSRRVRFQIVDLRSVASYRGAGTSRELSHLPKGFEIVAASTS